MNKTKTPAAPAVNETQLRRWRLILGKASEDKLQSMGSGGALLGDTETVMDQALAAIYDETKEESGGKGAGLGPSYPNLAKWLTDIRSYFPSDVVSVIQGDAIERKGLKQLLLEPETLATVKPDINMVSTLLSLQGHIPKKSKEQARQLVKALVDEIMQYMEHDLKRAVTGALNRRQHSPIPSLPNTDWKRTIRKNLKNYDREKKRIIPEKFYFFENRRHTKDWQIILDMDQSGSMADSIIYASIMGSIFASMPALDTRIVAFDTEVVDLTESCGDDPVDILFGVQLGGGTDINKSVKYCSQFVENPKKTMFILISDLYEGGVEAGLLRQLGDLKESGVTVLVLLALSDRGVPAYDEALARKISGLGIPAFGCTPNKLPELIGGALKGDDLHALAERVKIGAGKDPGV
ncbi:VWA domain-containing protein [Breznakiella homolactica]|uniref:VWA domain-containing protein n=1 Tax=Breznakiella homolactica TaxID=2798577 RepID=A0A7T7XPF6_9SPIR|nr:VWA domain-containing protein [Breznakiella homolactica]QQO09958.1 VWA domain-containing protein [Breznakiella homolactica]